MKRQGRYSGNQQLHLIGSFWARNRGIPIESKTAKKQPKTSAIQPPLYPSLWKLKLKIVAKARVRSSDTPQWSLRPRPEGGGGFAAATFCIRCGVPFGVLEYRQHISPEILVGIPAHTLRCLIVLPL